MTTTATGRQRAGGAGRGRGSTAARGEGARARAGGARWRALGIALALALGPACSRVRTEVADAVDGAAAGPDLTATVVDLAPPPCDDVAAPCPDGKRCLAGACVEITGCTGDDDCQDDRYCACAPGSGSDAGPCLDGLCVGYGDPPRGLFDPDCVTASFSPAAFQAPQLKCAWTDEGSLDTPLVIDLDRDGLPEIVFVTYPSGDLVAMRGKDCKVLFRLPLGLATWSQMAAGDLDGDKLPEIVALTEPNYVQVLDRKGNLLASSDVPVDGVANAQGVALVDLDGKAPPEIVVGGFAFRYTRGNPVLKTLWNHRVSSGYWGAIPAVADLDNDRVPDVVVGREVFDGKTGADKTPAAWAQDLAHGAFGAIADFNRDGRPDVLLAALALAGETIGVWDWAGKRWIFGPITVESSWNGAPVVADLDGDKIPDFGISGSNRYRAFAMKCWPGGNAKGCAGKDQPGLLWSKAVRDQSGLSGGAAFDFNGDGKVEIVYRDECFLRVLDGATGKTAFLSPVTSGTVTDFPVVADVDADGHADVVVVSDDSTGATCQNEVDADTGQAWKGPATQGVLVFRDPRNRWLPSRPLWNQHSYHITNVNDDGTIPLAPESPSWKTWNNYRQNVPGTAALSAPGTDYTGRPAVMIDNGGQDCQVSERLWARVCNRGTAIAPQGVPGTFYPGDPRAGARPLCTGTTLDPILPGECADLFCDWAGPTPGASDLWFRADDDGTKASALAECHTGNNLLFLPGYVCGGPG